MTDQPHIHHADFTVERQLETSPGNAFRFFSDPELKARWNDCHTDWEVLEDSFDFREGGTEAKHWRMPDGTQLTFGATYLDIVPDSRIIYAYEMTLGGTRVSASLVTVTFAAAPYGTHLQFTEQAALIGGDDEARGQRLAGTEEGIDRLVGLLQSAQTAT